MFKNLKLLKIISIFIILINTIIPSTLADDYNEDIDNEPTINDQIIETSSAISDIPDINSRAAVVIDRNSNKVLFGKNENIKRKMASTTKIMTCLLVIENCDLSQTIEVSKKSALTGGSRLGLKTGDIITVKDLIYGLMLCSGNDAAVALAEHVSGNVENFATLMNNKAKEIGLENTNFETPHGLDSDNHYTTAYELALLANYALQNDIFSKIVGTKSYTVTINGNPKTITNTNELLGNLNGVYGIKTGFTNGANRCLVTACKRDNLDIICVVLGADTKKFRTKDSIKLIEYCFKTYEPVSIKDLVDKNFKTWKEKNLNSFNLIKSQNNNIDLKLLPLKNDILPIEKNNINALNCFITCNKNLEAPLNYGVSIGKIEIVCNENVISNTDIVLNCTINKKNMLDYFYGFWKIIPYLTTKKEL